MAKYTVDVWINTTSGTARYEVRDQSGTHVHGDGVNLADINAAPGTSDRDKALSWGRTRGRNDATDHARRKGISLDVDADIETVGPRYEI